MAKDLLDSKPYHEVDSVILDNQLKRLEAIKMTKEIEMLRKQLKDYKVTRFIAWSGAAIAVFEVYLRLIK